MSGNWVPVDSELNSVELLAAEVDDGSWQLPADLDGGAFLRIGTNLRCWPPSNAHHPFNGDSMIHRIDVKNSSLFYSNSWVDETPQPDALSTSDNSDNLRCSSCSPVFSFGDVNAGGLSLLRLLLVKLRTSVLGITSPTQERAQPGSTNIIALGDKTYAVSEVTLPYEIQLANANKQQQQQALTPVGFSDLDGLLGQEHNRPGWSGPAEAPMSAHPRMDPLTGETFFFSANQGPGAQPYVNFVRVPREGGGNGTRLQIPVPGHASALYHDMFLTEHYAVMVHSSLRRDPARLVAGKGVHYFAETEPLRFGVLPRNAQSPDEIVWVAAPRPGHIWHTVTGIEEGNDTLVLYAPKFDAYSANVPIHLAAEEPSYLTRFVLNLTNGTCTETRIFDEVVERPTVNPNLLSHRYTYLRSEGHASQETGRRIVKFDLQLERAVGSIECGTSDCLFGEALFVPRSSLVQDKMAAEDDGYLMDFVYEASTHSSRFSVWSAATMAERPLVSAPLPQRVPHGAHGTWISSAQH
jgi:carotenoid cleavage dioxygenase